MLKKTLIALCAALISGLTIYTLWFNHAAAPAVKITSLSGQQLSLNELKGNVVLVNFWATSCSACIEEMPKLKELHHAFSGRNVTILAIAMSYDTPHYVQTFIRHSPLPFFVAIDTHGTIAHAFDRVQLTPTTFLIGPDNTIIKRYVGSIDEDEIRQLIETYLK